MKRQLHILRITVEAISPVSVGSGEEIQLKVVTKEGKKEVLPDVMALMRDANGLPTVTGASAQGVLRSLYEKINGPDKTDKVFGYAGPNDEGQAGRTTFSWAAVHGADDKAIAGLKDLRGSNDAFLNRLLKDAPLHRDHVALNENHSVDGRKKFARTAVPVGTRFSFELSTWGNDGARDQLLDVARYFRHPQFRLGGATKRGYGRVKVVRASYTVPDLSDPTALRKLRRQPPSRAFSEGNIFDDAKFAAPSSQAIVATLTLNFTDGVRIGGATPPDDIEAKDRFKSLWALRELRFGWRSGEAREKLRFPLPGSAFRGPLAHRMAYYVNKAGGSARQIKVEEFLELSEDECKAKLAELATRPAQLHEFLGYAKEKASSTETGMAAKLCVDDACLRLNSDPSQQQTKIQHNSIDRFTGGVRDQTGVLFSEEILHQPTAEVVLTIDPPQEVAGNDVDGWDRLVADSFLKSLRDICTGRLPIGARSLGVCSGTVEWQGPQKAAWEKAWDDVIAPAVQKGGS